MIKIKSKEEQDIMRAGGKILAQILTELRKFSQPGKTKIGIDRQAASLCKKYKVMASFKGYGGFPNSVCISINDEVAHGLATDQKLEKGDLVTLDMGVLHQGFHTDSAVSFICGEAKDIEKSKLINTCEQSFYSGLKLIKNGVQLGDISAEIQATAESAGFGVIRMLVGHGIGQEIHGDPHIPNFGQAGTGPELKTGMTLAIEPMIIADGSVEVVLSDDGWTYRSKSGALTAHYEHTILVTDTGCEILTKN